MQYTDSPDYLKGADLHNIGAGNESFFDDPIGQTADFVEKIPAFAITSVASGINSIYNSGVAAGNFFGLTDAKENDLQETLGSYDADLSNYYGAHKQAVDTAGFIATSFVPGIGGVKLLNTGQRVLAGALETGSVGRTFAEATGLITTVGKDGLTLGKKAGLALAEGQQTFSLMNSGVLKAIGAGVGSATLEAAAFEAMVQATMFKSPVLEGQDFKDVASNIVTGALLGGVIGGALNAAKVSGEVKKVITAADLEQKKFTLRSSQFGLQNPADRILVAAHDLNVTPVAEGATETALSNTRITNINQEIRTNIHALAKGDADLGNVIADTFQGSSGDDIARAFQGAAAISRPGAMGEAGEGHTIGFVKLHGEGAGTTTFTPIKNSELTLADIIPGGKAKILDTVQSYADGWKGKGALWNPITALGMPEVEARYIWAEKMAKYQDGMTIHTNDIPLLEGALRNKLDHINVTDGVHEYRVGAADLQNEVEQSKLALANELAKSKRAGWGFNAGAAPDKNVSTITSNEIARAVNVSVKRLESEESASMFARQDAQAAYDTMRAQKGIKAGESDLSFIPQHASVAYKTAGMMEQGGDLVSAMTNIRIQQKLVQDAVDKAVASVAGDLSGQLVRPGDSAIRGSNRYGAGAGLFTFANGAIGTLASWAENIGAVTARLQANLAKDTAAITDSVALRLKANQVAAIEFDKINNLVASTTEKYVLNETGDGLVAKKLADYEALKKAGKATGVPIPVLEEGALDRIPFSHSDVGDAIAARLETNGSRVTKGAALKNAQGLTDQKDPSVYYPLKPQPRDYPYFAFVKDETVTGAGLGHTSMIHANSQDELNRMITMARERTGYSVYTKADTENFFKAQQSYEWDRTLHDNYMDSSLKSAGVNNQFFPKTDPSKIVDSWLEAERRADSVLARDTVSTKFGHEFDQLQTLGEQYTNVASSRYGVSAKSIEGTVQNPYNDYRKTALNISRLSEHPLLTAFNRNLESAVSGVYQKVVDAWDSIKSVEDLQKVNDALKAAGVDHAYKNAAEVLLANHTAPRPYLSNFIRGANAILSNTFLRLDPLNALNNAIGAQVLLGHETSGQVRNLMRSMDEAGVMVPGTQDTILSPAKLIAKANTNYWKAMTGDPIAALNRETYRAQGWTSTISDQHKAMLDTLSLGGTENPAQLNTKLSQALGIAKGLTEKGEVWSGNKLAEEYNRFVAADVGRQISDMHIKAGLMQQDAQTSFISTFVNRTQGNTLASQRPLIFQGPIGQAVGLFQTFQFNTMQQLFRGVAEGGPKDAAMLMGLQGTMYGLNGLPGFQYINQHIVGTASGNPNHTDAYSTLYGAAGKTAGDWLMYGIPSNILQTNIYSRGDINPRSLTVIPTSPGDVVAVSAFAKFASNLKETVGKIAGGGNVWQSVLQGFEHNGLSRPLAGLAQTLQAVDGGKVYSTTNAGDVSFVNDLFSLSTLSRLAGGKPLDEALAADEVARSKVYQAADHERMKAATEAFKTTVIGDTSGQATPAAVHDYMGAFVKNGGRVEQFNQNMLHAMTRVNTPRANQIIGTLKGPYAEHMKSLMGGAVEDFGDQ